jgi:hypothetical protein
MQAWSSLTRMAEGQESDSESPSSAARSAAVQINCIAGISIGNCDPILANVARVKDAEQRGTGMRDVVSPATPLERSDAGEANGPSE